MSAPALRQLVLVLGDQLDAQASVFQDFDPQQDALWMAEVQEESTHVPSSRIRIALFLSAMRHFAQAQRALGRTVHYRHLDDAPHLHSLAQALQHSLTTLRPQRLVMTAPGDWRVLKSLQQTAAQMQVPLTILEDTHFLTSVRDFAAYATQRKQIRLEYFYREVRRKTGLLMQGDQPIGGQWNFDADNRSAFPSSGPPQSPAGPRFEPDALTQAVLTTVAARFPNHVGDLTSFRWPVTREDALLALEDFVAHRLPLFGQYQDAMWTGEAWLFHSYLSSALNLKLLHPLEVARAAQAAYEQGTAALAAVEGFIRQVIGWREYVRGIYWTEMPQYLERNALAAHQPVPSFYWTGETDMACLLDALTQTLRYGYAHHIQRLMVTGLYGLLLGVNPQGLHEWYLSVYVDAVEWVELPNTLGMSQFADGGRMASKPYVASGKYIARMSNYCKGCRFDPAQATGEQACPLTTLYWDFLMRHADALARNPRMVMQLKNLHRLSDDTREAIQAQAQRLRDAARA